MANQLSSDTMFDIFSRMPVKSLARFCCVSKLWRNYINDPYLETMHAKRETLIHHPMLILFYDQNPRANVPKSSCTLGFLKHKEEEEEEEGDCSTLELEKKQPVMKFTCKGWSSRYTFDMFVGFCKGMLYTLKQESSKGRNVILVVINPLRKECYELPPISRSFVHGGWSWGRDLEESYGLGFDDSTNTFKMVFVLLREQTVWDPHYIYNAKVLYTIVHVLGTDSWRKIHKVPSYPITGEPVFANGSLHWLSSYRYYNHPANVGRAVITFDMVNEEFGLINAPHDYSRSSGEIVEHLVDLDGEVGYVYSVIGSHVEVWLLKEERWVMHCKFEQKPPLPEGFIKVLGFWNEKGDILVTSVWKRMFIYNLESGGLNEVKFVNRIEELRKGGLEIRMYQPSLFSRRYSIKKVNLI